MVQRSWLVWVGVAALAMSSSCGKIGDVDLFQGATGDRSWGKSVTGSSADSDASPNDSGDVPIVPDSGVPITELKCALAAADVRAAPSWRLAYRTRIPLERQPDHFVIGDVTGDGINDIVAAFPPSVSLFVGNGAGGFEAPLPLQLAAALQSSVTAMALVNADSRPGAEVVVASNEALQVLSHDGVVRAVLGGGFLATSTNDIDRDGNADIVALAFDGTVVSYFGDGQGEFVEPVSLPLTAPFQPPPLGVSLQDMTADGYPDVVLWNSLATLGIIPNDGFGSFLLSNANVYEFAHAIGWPTIAVGDVDADGRPDFVGSDSFSVVVSLQSTGFAESVLLPSSNEPRALAIADMNLDGCPDIVEISDGPSVYLGNPQGISDQILFYLGSTGRLGPVVVADMNGDDCPDIVTSECCDNFMIYFGSNCASAN